MTSLRYRALDAALAADALPDWLLRAGSRYGARRRERHESRGGLVAQEERLRALLERMRTGPIAEQAEQANRQHYELPSDFLGMFLGPRRKYSCCLWGAGVDGLAEAEEAMLELTCQRAGVADGMRILDLGCGWGSLSLWLAERYPDARITAVSNSTRQGAYIERRATELGLGNLSVMTANVNDLALPGEERYDRVISLEMFEHMRNWHELLRRISGWLADDGELFLHVFSHRTLPYRFEGTWAAERFFTAGLMPSHELLAFFQDDMRLVERWALPGTHYARTLEAWLSRLDANAGEALALLERDDHDPREAAVLLGGWRLFLISTAEIWRRDQGKRWMVSQYRLKPRASRAAGAG